MKSTSPLWGAELDRIRFDSVGQDRLAEFYCKALAMTNTPLIDGTRLLRGEERRLIVGAGQKNEQPYSAFRIPSKGHLDSLKHHLASHGINLMPSPTPLFGAEAFAINDPDGRQVVFGLPDPLHEYTENLPQAPAPGRLQHVVVATDKLPPMAKFYQTILGFVPTDHVLRDEADGSKTLTAIFYRTTSEHHSLAVFLSDTARPDHHAYEVSCWNDIRDWADHMSDLYINLWWGPGRHGPGNNLFFMIEDPDGHKVEISAELETIVDGANVRYWPHNERSLNLWGPSWMRT